MAGLCNFVETDCIQGTSKRVECCVRGERKAALVTVDDKGHNIWSLF